MHYISRITVRCLLLITILTSLSLPGNARAATIITAEDLATGATWTQEASPYIINDALTVPEGTLLTLMPGTVMKFGPAGSLDILGKVDAKGTASENVIITSTTDSGYGGDTTALGNSAPPPWLTANRMSIEVGGSLTAVNAKFLYNGFALPATGGGDFLVFPPMLTNNGGVFTAQGTEFSGSLARGYQQVDGESDLNDVSFHDIAGAGIAALDGSMTLTGVTVERAKQTGILVDGALVTGDGVHVRSIQGDGIDVRSGRGAFSDSDISDITGNGYSFSSDIISALVGVSIHNVQGDGVAVDSGPMYVQNSSITDTGGYGIEGNSPSGSTTALAYVQLMRSAVASMDLGTSTARQLTAKLGNIQNLLQKNPSWDDTDDDNDRNDVKKGEKSEQRVLRKLDKLESWIGKQLGRRKSPALAHADPRKVDVLAPKDAETLLAMIDRLRGIVK